MADLNVFEFRATADFTVGPVSMSKDQVRAVPLDDANFDAYMALAKIGKVIAANGEPLYFDDPVYDNVFAVRALKDIQTGTITLAKGATRKVNVADANFADYVFLAHSGDIEQTNGDLLPYLYEEEEEEE